MCVGKLHAALAQSSGQCNIYYAILQVSTQLYVHAAGNPLLNYLKGLEADSVKSLTMVSEDGVEAMNTFIHRLLGEHTLLTDNAWRGVDALQSAGCEDFARCMTLYYGLGVA